MSIKINEIVNYSVGRLQKTLIGGVTEKSAKKAIEETAQAVKAATEISFKKTIEETHQLNAQTLLNIRKNHQEYLERIDSKILSLTKEKNELTKTNEKLTTKLDKLTQRIKNLLKFNQIDTLADGSKVYVKTNLNGTKATKIIDKEGKITQINIALADKMFKKTSYNPKTGFPVTRLTNATKDGSIVKISYDEMGKTKEIQTINVKKVKSQKPTIIDKAILEDTDYHIVTKANLSDGSILTTKTERSSGEIYYWDKKSPNYNLPTEWYEKNVKTGVIRRGSLVNNDGIWFDKVTITYPNGVKVIEPFSKTQNDITGSPIITSRIKFPKGTSVKHIDINTIGDTANPYLEIVTLRNGEKVELSDYKYERINQAFTQRRAKDKILFPQKAIKITKDGTKTEMPNDEIRPWLEEFHPRYNDKITKIKYLNI